MQRIFFIALIIIITGHVNAQELFRFVDFHIHPTMKQYYRSVPHPDSLKSDAFTQSVSYKNWIHDTTHKYCTGFSGINDYTQSNYYNISKLNSAILCTSITPIEKQFVSDEKIPLFRVPFSKRIVYAPITFRFINEKVVTKLSKQRMAVLADENLSSFDEFMAEYKFTATQQESDSLNSYHVKFVRNGEELRNNLKDKTASIILTIEGGHVLLGKQSLVAYDSTDFNTRSTPYWGFFTTEDEAHELDSILSNIRKVKQLEHKTFFITPGHLSWNKIVGQTKGLDMDAVRPLLGALSASRKFREGIYNKQAEGFFDTVKVFEKDFSSCECVFQKNSEGYGEIVLSTNSPTRKIMLALLDTTEGLPRILIDVKHMDIKSRFDYYNLVDELERNTPGLQIPIIASHFAVSGKKATSAVALGSCPFADNIREVQRPKCYYKKSGKACGLIEGDRKNLIESSKWFYPWAVNLCDEEIERIYKSDGIIGVTIEKRVTGAGMRGYKGKYKRERKKYLQAKNYTKEEIKNYCSAEPFMRNLLYVVSHSGQKDADGNIKFSAWDHVAFGTDLDGVVFPIDVASKVDKMNNFYKMLGKFLPDFADFTNQKSVLCNQQPFTLLDKLFYQNGQDFILKYF